jgi:hypothetical protein
MPQWRTSRTRIANAGLSPTGKRAVFEARGEIFTVPAEKGDWRNLTNTPGVGGAQRRPGRRTASGSRTSAMRAASTAWSSRRRTASASRARSTLPEPSVLVHARMVAGLEEAALHRHAPAAVGGGRGDGQGDARGHRHVHGAGTLHEPGVEPGLPLDRVREAPRQPVPRHLRVFDWRTAAPAGHRRHVDATWPAWDAGGKYLYFLASTNYGLNTGWLDMSSYDRPVTRALYLAVLRKGEPSPLLPESDEEGAAPARGSAGASAPAARARARRDCYGAWRGGAGTAQRAAAANVAIDFDGILQRTISLGVVPRNYSQLRAGAAGTIFFLETVPESGAGGPAVRGNTLHRYMLKEREAKTFLANVQGFTVSADGSRSCSTARRARTAAAGASSKRSGRRRPRARAGSMCRPCACWSIRARNGADVRRGLAFPAGLPLRRQPARRRLRRTKAHVRAAPRARRAPLRPELPARHAGREVASATPTCAAATCRTCPAPASACSAPTSKSPTAATASRRSTPARAGTPNSRAAQRAGHRRGGRRLPAGHQRRGTPRAGQPVPPARGHGQPGRPSSRSGRALP